MKYQQQQISIVEKAININTDSVNWSVLCHQETETVAASKTKTFKIAKKLFYLGPKQLCKVLFYNDFSVF